MKKEEEKIVNEVLADFKERAEKRKSLDLIWQEVFNHIAPTFDIRYAKLTKVDTEINILPSTNDERDVKSAKVSKKIIKSIKNKLKLQSIIAQGIKWSEVCGTCFYKITWNSDKGQVVGLDESGRPVRSGEVEVSVVSPFEIYPDNLVTEKLEDVQSIIHAKAYSTEEVKAMFDVTVKGQDVNVYSLDSVNSSIGGLGFNGTMPKMIESRKSDSVLVIERYNRPNATYPNGRLTIVAGDKLVYDGDLPYKIGSDDERDFPFVKQTAIEEPGSFFGTSIIERLIPVQRAYNAVKNRKHEFINRLSMGVLSVEDGSVDLDNLEDEGLSPGKILVYRQGSSEPKYLQGESLPNGLSEEENALLEEFNKISGVNDILNSSSLSTNISGTALELLISQDEERLNASIESIRGANIEIARKILKLYKQYAIFPRLARIVGENGQVELFYFSSCDISSDDVEIENVSSGLSSMTQRREMIFSLLEKGILKMLDGVNCKVSEIDEDNLHINEHIAFMLGSDYEKMSMKNANLERVFLEHIRAHRQKMEG